MTDKELSAKILKLVGGENNIKSFANCVTQLRFTLKDNNKANINQLKALDEIMDVQTQGGQLQIIVGSKAEKFAAELRGIVTINDQKEGEGKGEKKGILNTLLDVLSGILIPSLPQLSAEVL